MNRKYIHRYRILSGPLAGTVANGINIGDQDYPDQWKIESLTHDRILERRVRVQAQGLCGGIWLIDTQQVVRRPLPVQGGYRSKVEITPEGVNYDDVYMDLCVPHDRYGNEIHVGDTLIVASKNEARRVVVERFATKPFMASYGIMQRKITVRDELEQQTLTINDCFATIRVGNETATV
jgi:hypothetical protein